MADWKEFMIDKGADFVIAFTGLYLAIGVQGWWDDRKDHDPAIRAARLPIAAALREL